MNDLESRLRAALHDETAEVAAPPELADTMVDRGTRARRRRRVVGGAAGLLVLAALVPIWKSVDLSSGATPPAKPPATTVVTPAPPTTPRPSEPTTTGRPVWSTKRVDVTHDPNADSRIVNLRVGLHRRYDRVVVDFEGPIYGYSVRYVREFVPPEGDPQPLPGTAVLTLQLHGASHDQRGRSVFLGPKSPTYGLPAVVASTYSDYEGYVDFGVGLTDRTRFRVFEQTLPNRLVVDILH